MSSVAVIGATDDGGEGDIAYVNSLSYDKIRAALTLWSSGANFAEIATQLSMRSPAAVQVAVERALAEMVDDTTDRPRQRRRLTLALDRLLKATMGKAIDPAHPEQLQAVRTTLAIIERYARLNALDAPTEHVIHMPGQDEFSAFIEAAARGQGMEMPVEADPFSDEYVIDADEVDEDGDDAAEPSDR